MNTISQLSRLGLFDSRVPRYTSYPTAPQFTGAVGALDMAEMIRRIPPGSDISLYVHVPFCRRLCWFCACRTQGTSNDTTVQHYLDTLMAEIALLARHLPPDIRLSRLHWGGGTPTLLSARMIGDLADEIRSVLPLALDGEFSVEIDPNEIDAPRLDALAEAGVTRASIGVQDFDPGIQKTIGRAQGFDETFAAVQALRAHRIDSLNVDILYGLPHQTPSRIADNVQRLLTLGPDRVALHGYAHVPWMARRQAMIPAETLPTPAQRLTLFETARALMLWDGYRQIGTDHFALPGDGLERAARAGTLRRDFKGYTDDTAPVLVGLGASSISRFPQGYVQNATATGDYTRAIRAGRFAGARGHMFAGDDLLRARIIEALMCDLEVSMDELREDFGLTPWRAAVLFEPVAVRFAGFVDLDSSGMRIREKGRPLTRMIARAFDAYELSTAGHSQAV